jgi:hypothetical protein
MYSSPISLTLDLESTLGKNILLTALNNMIRGNFNTLQLETQVLEPQIKEGAIVYADGVSWNPGSGEGFYGYVDGSWKLLNNVTVSFSELPSIDFALTTSAPTVTEGMIAFANGSTWNPTGQGKGFYGYHSGAWHKLDIEATSLTNLTSIDFAPLQTEPSNPTDGMLAFALSGIYWDPGSGAGLYMYHNGTWNFLG